MKGVIRAVFRNTPERSEISVDGVPVRGVVRMALETQAGDPLTLLHLWVRTDRAEIVNETGATAVDALRPIQDMEKFVGDYLAEKGLKAVPA